MCFFILKFEAFYFKKAPELTEKKRVFRKRVGTRVIAETSNDAAPERETEREMAQ